MKEYIERASAERVIAAIMPSMSTPDGAGTNSEMVFAAQEMCADALSAVHRLPAADVAEVVRCRECIYYKICDEWETGKRMLCEIHHHSYLDHDGDEHFCSWGQRREAEHDKHPSDPL